jgi:hypothetical protein
MFFMRMLLIPLVIMVLVMFAAMLLAVQPHASEMSWMIQSAVVAGRG